MKFSLPAILLITIIFSADTTAQNIYTPKLSLSHQKKSSAAESISFYKFMIMVFPLNPEFLIENKKFYAGITKEVSLGFFPYGRLSSEYSLIFRETRVNHLRFSYNYDFAIEAGDFAAFVITAGGGYFTDFNKEGYFPQLSFALLFPLTDNIATNPYIKFRHTFITDKDESDISDLSFGFGLYISF